MLICTEAFLPLARTVAAQQGFDALSMLPVRHPIAAESIETLENSLQMSADRLANGLIRYTSVPRSDAVADSDLVSAPRSAAEFLDFAMERGISDGFPLVPPDVTSVEAAVAESKQDADYVLGPVPPSNRGATTQAVAANAVMAGCPARLMPVVVAAVRAVLEPRFNLSAITTTTHPATPLVIVHGAIVDEFGFNGGANTLGQGNRANATVGRALRLVLQNVGGASPGRTDKATHGSPGKYSYCMAENHAATPWETFHEHRGEGIPAGAVTVVGAEGLHNVNDHGSNSGNGVLRHIAGVLAGLGSNNVHARGEMLLILGPEHAQLLSSDGFDRRGIQEWLIREARVDIGGVSNGNLERFQLISPHVFRQIPEDHHVPVLDRAEDLLVIVAGGPGRHSVVVPTFGYHASATVAV